MEIYAFHHDGRSGGVSPRAEAGTATAAHAPLLAGQRHTEGAWPCVS
jgi:hypothetical protein